MWKRRLCCSMLVLFACTLTWWFTPVRALQTDETKVAAIAVTNEITGHRFTIRANSAVDYITENLSTQQVVRSRFAGENDGTVYDLLFLDANGKELDHLSLNHGGSMRRGGMFYHDTQERLCFRYLSRLESHLFGTGISADGIDEKPAPEQVTPHAAHKHQ
jgi:hypothetical protein